jgi:RNA polymerase I-specific transcription initiation factor RRN6
MADRAENGQLYGTFGAGAYNLDIQDWEYERSTTRSLSLCPLGDTRVLHTGPNTEDPASHCDALTGEDRSKQIKDLVKSYPELQPAIDILPDLAKTSEAVIRAASRHDPLKGQLVVAGKVNNQEAKRTDAIIAFPTGPSGGDLQLVHTEIRKQGLNGTHGDWLAVPTPSGEMATWKGPGVPIQALKSASPIHGGHNYLAVRLLTKTSILWPRMSGAPPGTGSRLKANWILDLNINDTGGITHADVAFNPWNPRLFAVVDLEGIWSVWKLRHLATGRARQVCGGVLHDDVQDTIAQAVPDGFHRISWVHNGSVLAVCDRCALKLFDISDAGNEVLLDLELNLAHNIWILDMVILSKQPSYICVLTSAHIALYAVNRDLNGNTAVERLALVDHYRSTSDLSLHLRILEDGEGMFVKPTTKETP